MKLRYVVFALSLVFPFLLQNCAQVAQPPGGKKDTLAPRLISSLPKERQLNYAGKSVELEFSEYVNSENLQQKVTVTPQDSNTFVIKSLPKGVRLTFAKPLQARTTYTIDFADGIKDITERNVATDTKIVFSTGPVLDSLSLSGTVVDDETRLPLLKFVVGLFSPTDTLPINRKRPQYFARTDSSGNYRIENVKAGPYRVYGFDDKDLNLVNNAPTERVAFRDSILNLNRNYAGVNLVAFRSYAKPRVSRRERTDETLGLELSSGIVGYQIKFPKPGDTLISFLESPKLIRLFRPADRAAGDTLNLTIAAQDSVGNVTDLRERVYFSPLKTRTKNRAPLTVRVTPAPGEPIDNNLLFTLTFNKPVLRYDTLGIRLYADSTKPLALTRANLTWSNNYGKLTIKRTTTLRDSLFLRLPKGTFISVQGDTAARYQARYRIAEEDAYGLIAGRVSPATVAGKKFVVELVDDKYQVIRTASNAVNYSFGRLRPGRYRVRLVIDANGNGKRDIGNVQKMLQPEPILYHPGAEEGGIIVLKQNFELTDIDF